MLFWLTHTYTHTHSAPRQYQPGADVSPWLVLTWCDVRVCMYVCTLLLLLLRLIRRWCWCCCAAVLLRLELRSVCCIAILSCIILGNTPLYSRTMKIVSWNISISGFAPPHWIIQIKTGNGENHIAEINQAGIHFNETHNRKQGTWHESKRGGASSKTWGELQQFIRAQSSSYNVFTNNCIQLSNAVAAFLQ
jgi:hypothetical protein